MFLGFRILRVKGSVFYFFFKGFWGLGFTWLLRFLRFSVFKGLGF